MVKHVDAAELRIDFAVLLAAAADAVLVENRLSKLVAHLVTALARLHVRNLARRSSREAGSTREKKGGEERRNARNSVRQFGTGNRKFRWHARVHPERGIKMILPLLPLELWAPCKARWVWAGAVISPTHKRTEGRAPVWGSEFTSKNAALQGGSSRNRCR